MDPSIGTGQRKYFTNLDLAALRDVGWQVSAPVAVPLSDTLIFLFSGMLALTYWGRRHSAPRHTSAYSAT